MSKTDAVTQARKTISELTARAVKIEAKLEKARAELAEIDSAAVDLDDDQAVAKAAKRRREAADLIAALDAQRPALESQRAATDAALKEAESAAAAAELERARGEAAKLDGQIAESLRAALQAASAEEARLAEILRSSEAARAKAGAGGHVRTMFGRGEIAGFSKLLGEIERATR